MSTQNHAETLARALESLIPLVPFDGNHADETSKGQQLRAARRALAEYQAQPQGYTVALQELGNSETTHVTFQSAADVDAAVAAASAECAADWGDVPAHDQHILAVMRGDVEVLYWCDQ